MNANSTLPTPVVKDWLKAATVELTANDIPSASLDAEVILMSTLGVNKTFLHAHPDQELNDDQITRANQKLDQRLKRVPIAYIIGHKEFYGRDFLVTPATLIPRPESEDIINSLKEIASSNPGLTNLVDVGTGSGCLGISAKLELPFLDVTLIDFSPSALEIAGKNARKLSADVTLVESDLLSNYNGKKIDIIIANLPYVNPSWTRSPETDHEPSSALFAEDNGQALIKKLIEQSVEYINPNGFLIIEADPEQHNSLIEYADKYSYEPTDRTGYILTFYRNSDEALRK